MVRPSLLVPCEEIDLTAILCIRWDFTRKHNVQLPDEYDQIHRDLQPHRALYVSLLGRVGCVANS